MKFLISLLLVLQTCTPAYTASTRTVVADQIKNSALTNTYAFPASGDTLVGRTSTDTLTNKTLTTPAIDVPLFTDQSSAPSTPAAGKRKFYSKTTGKFYQLDSAGVEREIGSGGTGTNFVVGGDAEGGSIFATYKDAAASSPVDGTGGIPTVANITTTAISPLVGANSFLLTHPASNVQGEGWSYDFTIDAAYQAKVLQLSFDYIVNSGTFVAGTASDVTVWIYDKTNNILISPSSTNLLSNSATVSDKFNATFQSSSNSTSYRLIFHSATTSASAFTLRIDSVTISPSTYVYGTNVTDWVSYTPAVSNLGTGGLTTNLAKWRRVGDSMEVLIYTVKDASAGTGGAAVTWGLPSGYSVDTAKLPNNSGSFQVLGTVLVANSGVTQSPLFLPANNAVYTFNASGQWNGSSWAASAAVTLHFTIPIQGWSSSVQTSDQTDTRVVAATYTTASTSLTNNTEVVIPFTAKVIDTHSGYNTSTGVYTFQVAGNYRISAASRMTAYAGGPNTQALRIRKNGTLVIQNGITTTTTSTAWTNLVTGTLSFNVGDTMDIVGFQDSGSARTLNGNSFDNYFSIERISGPSAISATESYNFRYTNVAGTALTAGTNTLTFSTLGWDSHGSWSGNTFTPNIAGKFSCSVKISVNTIAGLSTNYIRILVAGSTVSEKALAFSYSTATPYTFDLTDTINVTAGQAVTFQFQNGFGSTVNMDTGVGRNSVSCQRVGN